MKTHLKKTKSGTKHRRKKVLGILTKLYELTLIQSPPNRYFFLFFGSFRKLILTLPLPRLASAVDMEAVEGLWAGEAVALWAELDEGLDTTLGVTTAGEPGPRSMRLSSVGSANI